MKKLLIYTLLSLLLLSISLNLFQYSSTEIICKNIDNRWKADLLYKMGHNRLDGDKDGVPCENTIAYFPFKEDALDKVGSRSLTINDCAVSNGVMNINSQASYMLLSSTIGGSQITGSVWYYYGALSTGGGWNTLFAKNGGTYHHILMPATTNNGTVGNIGFYSSGWYPSSKVLELGKWYHIVFVKNGTNEKIYVNAELVLDSNSSFDNNSQPLGIISSYNTSGGNQGAQGKMSELFFEDKLWNINEITDYYNLTKSNYGL